MPDTSDTHATRVTRVRHECDTSASWRTRVRHECYMNSRVRHEWKILIIITTRVKTYFHTPIFTMWQVKDYKERDNFILRTTFWKWLVSMPKCVWKVHHKNWTLGCEKLNRIFLPYIQKAAILVSQGLIC